MNDDDDIFPILDTYCQGTQVRSQFAEDYEGHLVALAFYQEHMRRHGAWFVSRYEDGSLHCVPTSGFIDTTKRRLEAMKAGMH